MALLFAFLSCLESKNQGTAKKKIVWETRYAICEMIFITIIFLVLTKHISMKRKKDWIEWKRESLVDKYYRVSSDRYLYQTQEICRFGSKWYFSVREAWV